MAITAPLRLSPANPRWFMDGEGKGVLLTSFHTWNNLVPMRKGDRDIPFDFPLYLRLLNNQGHNFIRLWAWDAICTWDPDDRALLFPWARTGPGVAVDGRPRFDLNTHDGAYFQALEERVRLAHEAGIYVGVMLFESWASFAGNTTPLDWHVFAGPNNINGIDARSEMLDGWMMGWMGLADPAITAVQDSYIERVVRLLNPFPNVIYEISNEASFRSYRWQEHVVRLVRSIEASLPSQHLVGITGGMNTRTDDFYTLDSDYFSAEGWVPEGEEAKYRDGTMVWGQHPEQGTVPIMVDTDHLWGIGGNTRWAWRSFLNGYHPLYMDRCDDLPWAIFDHPWWPDTANIVLREEIGRIGRFASQLDLNLFLPDPSRASTGCALASAVTVAAISQDGEDVELFGLSLPVTGTWQKVGSGETAAAEAEGGTMRFKNPWDGDAILLVSSQP